MSEEKPSSLWYLLPACLGIIGAIIMWAKLKDRNADMAMASIYLTLYSLIPAVIIIVILFGVIGMSGLNNMANW